MANIELHWLKKYLYFSYPYILEIEEGFIEQLVLFLLELLEGVINHHLKVGFKEANLILGGSIFISLLNEVVETLSLHKFLHEFFVVTLKLIEIVVKVEHVVAGQLVIN